MNTPRSATVVLAILLVGGCGASGGQPPETITTASSTPTATADPTGTPVPTATPVPSPSDEELAAVCAGQRLSEAGVYGGRIHPLVVAWEFDDGWSIDTYHEGPYGSGSLDQWSGPIQLALCVSTKTVRAASCGTYTVGDTSGKLTARQWVYTIRVVVARTGKVLQTKVLTGPKPGCPATLIITKGDPPPWNYYGDGVSDATINKYAKTVSTQAVK